MDGGNYISVKDAQKMVQDARRDAFEKAGEAAAVFVHDRLYKANFPACSYHSREIKEEIIALWNAAK